MSMNDIVHIGDLKPDARNARRHNPRNIGMIATSLQEVGAVETAVYFVVLGLAVDRAAGLAARAGGSSSAAYS